MAVRLSALHAGRDLPPEKYSGTNFCYTLSEHQGHRLERLGKLKKSITSLELEPTTFRFVTQLFNHLRYRVLRYESIL
jgi:hypothetical protein